MVSVDVKHHDYLLTLRLLQVRVVWKVTTTTGSSTAALSRTAALASAPAAAATKTARSWLAKALGMVPPKPQVSLGVVC